MSGLFKRVWGTSGASADKRPGRPSPSTAMTIDSIEALIQKEEHLEKRRVVLEQRIAKELETAKRYNKEQKKSQALMCLKKKKLYEKNMEDLGNLIMKVNEQRILLENAQTTAETLKAIEGATKASKNVLKENKIDNVDKLMEDIANDTETMRDINERIAEPASFMSEYDDDELLNELEDMEAESLDEQLLRPNVVPTAPVSSTPAAATAEEFPAVPATKVKQPPSKTAEEAELEELFAELN